MKSAADSHSGSNRSGSGRSANAERFRGREGEGRVHCGVYVRIKGQTVSFEDTVQTDRARSDCWETANASIRQHPRPCVHQIEMSPSLPIIHVAGTAVGVERRAAFNRSSVSAAQNPRRSSAMFMPPRHLERTVRASDRRIVRSADRSKADVAHGHKERRTWHVRAPELVPGERRHLARNVDPTGFQFAAIVPV
jgi:hypothetical protein